MAAAADPRPAAPTTPSKRRNAPDHIRRVVQDLSDKYDLAIWIPDHTLSPSGKSRLASEKQRHASILHRLQFHYYQGEGELEGLLLRFDQIARTICTNWVRKARGGGHDVLPVSAEGPRATTPNERAQLLDALSSLLDQASPRRPAQAVRIITARPPSDEDRPPIGLLATSSSCRRRSDDDLGAAYKRFKLPDAGSKYVKGEIDDVPVRFRTTATPQDLSFSRSISKSTGGVSLASAVFSVPEGGYSFANTQTTQAYSTQTGEKDEPTDTHSVDSFPASLDHLTALDESFSRYECTPPKLARTNFNPNARAILCPSEVLPTPGGPTKHRIGLRPSGFSFRTARYSRMRRFTLSRP